MGENLQSTARPGCLLIAVAITIPDALNQFDFKVLGNAHLVDGERLSQILDELGDFLRVLRFIKDPTHPSFPLQLLSAFLDIFQGSTGHEPWLMR
jgi:hypothetical protein